MPLPTMDNVSRPKSLGYGARINNNLYRLVASPEIASPVVEVNPPQPPRIDTAVIPEEMVEEFGTTFARNDFTGGEGLLYAHRRGQVEQDTKRFWASRGVDVRHPGSSEEPTLSIAPNVGQHDNVFWAQQHLETMDGQLFYAINSDVRRYNNPTTDLSTFSTEDPGLGHVRGLAVMGGELYAARGSDGVARRISATNWNSDWSNADVGRVWSVKGRLLARGRTFPGTVRTLTEVREGIDTSITIKTLGERDWWTSVIDAGRFILAGATNGLVYAFEIDENTNLVEVAQTSFFRQKVTGLATLGGVVLVGTSEESDGGQTLRLWRGQLTDTGTVTNLALIRTWRAEPPSDVEPESYGPRSFTTTHDRAYFFIDRGGGFELWFYSFAEDGRAELFTEPDWDHVSLTSALVIDDRLFFTFWTFDFPDDHTGLYRVDVEVYQSSGYLISPLIDFHTASDKSWTSIRVEPASDIPANTTITVSYTTNPEAVHNPNHTDWAEAGILTSNSTLFRFRLSEVVGRYLAIKLDLSTTDPAVTPEIRSFSVRALPADRNITLQLPINVSDQIELRGRHRQTVPGLGDRVYQSLKGFEGQSVRVELFRPREVVQGLIETVSTPVLVTDTSGSPTLVSVVKVRGERVVEGVDAEGGIFGASMFGASMFGGLDN